MQTGRGPGRVDAPPGRAGVRQHPAARADDQHGVLPVEEERGADDEADVGGGPGKTQHDHHQVSNRPCKVDTCSNPPSLTQSCNSHTVTTKSDSIV